MPALVQIMAWRRPGDKPLSEAMMVNLSTHICVSRPQWVKSYLYLQKRNYHLVHYCDVTMASTESQIIRLTIVYSTVYSDADQRKYQSSASLAFVRGIHRWPVKSPHKWPVTTKMFPFDDVIMMDILQPSVIVSIVAYHNGFSGTNGYIYLIALIGIFYVYRHDVLSDIMMFYRSMWLCFFSTLSANGKINCSIVQSYNRWNECYRKTSSISRTKSQHLNVSCILLQLSSRNPLKPGVKLRMKM